MESSESSLYSDTPKRGVFFIYPQLHALSMMRELREIHGVLEEGRQLSAELRADPSHAVKAKALSLARLRGLEGADLESAMDPRKIDMILGAEEGGRHAQVSNAVDYAQRHGFLITNSGRRWSEFDSPGQPYRPFTANAKLSEKNPLFRLQKALMARVFERIDGLYVFPAAGLDEKFLGARPVLSIGPYESEQSGGVLHLNKRAEALTSDEVLAAHRRFGLREAAPRVLVLKGIQTLIPQEELRKLFNRVMPTHVVAFGTAASGVIDPVKGMPHFTDEHRRFVEGLGFKDVTGELFSQEELGELEGIHGLLKHHFAWQSGHFPASQVRVFRKD